RLTRPRRPGTAPLTSPEKDNPWGPRAIDAAGVAHQYNPAGGSTSIVTVSSMPWSSGFNPMDACERTTRSWTVWSRHWGSAIEAAGSWLRFERQSLVCSRRGLGIPPVSRQQLPHPERVAALFIDLRPDFTDDRPTWHVLALASLAGVVADQRPGAD